LISAGVLLFPLISAGVLLFILISAGILIFSVLIIPVPLTDCNPDTVVLGSAPRIES
jgi:hypothetical protein